MNQIKHFDLKLPCPKLLLNELLEFYDVITSKDQVVGRAFNRGFARIEEPRKVATCKTCGKSMLFLSGNYSEDGYFEILRCHLRKHDEVLPLYLKKLEERIKNGDDSWKLKRKLKDDVDLFFNESSVMRDLNEQWCNIAEVPYMSELGKMGGYLKYRYQKEENFKMLEHLYKNFGKRLTEEERKDKELRTSSNILGDNVDGITTKLQKLFCEEVCFFDPELYESCSHNHNGDVAQFGDKEFQARFDGFEHEIEKYPEFQCDTSFDSEVLRNTSIKLDYNAEAVNELNRLLKIILSLWLVNKKNISMKLETIRKNAIVQEVFYKPLFGLLNWTSVQQC